MALARDRYRFTVDDYHRMGEAGLFPPEVRVELIDGDIVPMNPIGPNHAGHVDRLGELFIERLGRRVTVRFQNPIRLGRHGEPEPDLAILRRRPDFYTSGYPTPEDAYLLVEVADSSVQYDRQVKMPLYARFGIPEVWLVNLVEGHVVVYRDPTPDGYRTVHVARPGDEIRPLAFSELAVAVADILG